MFEDSLVESSGKLKTKRGVTTFLSFAFQMLMLGVMVLIPLISGSATPATTPASSPTGCSGEGREGSDGDR